MTSSERNSGGDRRGGRCPICGGPLATTEAGKERCRNSLCAYNHRDVECPRCGAKHLKSVWAAGGQYFFSCAKCQAKWSGS